MSPLLAGGSATVALEEPAELRIRRPFARL
jgi:hypothetical protein